MALSIIRARDGRSLLNLGCGSRFHPEWNNVDLHPTVPGILAHDLRKPLPFADNSFDVVYHSHLLEHFSPTDGLALLKECRRVCRPGGSIRVVVPNLGRIAQLYLECLEQAEQGEPQAESRYHWMVLELCDQMVRSRPGGEMAVFLGQAPAELAEFLESRIGKHFYHFYQSGGCGNTGRLRAFVRLSRDPRRLYRKGLNKIRTLLARILMAALWGRAGSAMVDEVLFRSQGEVHRWMYDRYSLPKALRQAGFAEIKICSAEVSGIADWHSFALDCDLAGTIYKPDSLFCEGVKDKIRLKLT